MLDYFLRFWNLWSVLDYHWKFENIENIYQCIPNDYNFAKSMDYVENILHVLDSADKDLGSVLLEYKQRYHSSGTPAVTATSGNQYFIRF